MSFLLAFDESFLISVCVYILFLIKCFVFYIGAKTLMLNFIVHRDWDEDYYMHVFGNNNPELRLKNFAFHCVSFCGAQGALSRAVREDFTHHVKTRTTLFTLKTALL